MEIRIPISILPSYAYCPYKAYLELSGVEGAETKELIMGRKWHDLLQKEYESKSNILTSIEEARKMAKEKELYIIFRELPVENEILYGKIDEVWITPVGIFIWDDKPKVWFGYKLQLMAYAYAMTTGYGIKERVVIGIRELPNRKIAWKDLFKRKHEKLVEKFVSRLLNNLERGEFKKRSGKFCKKCKYKKVCYG